MPKSKEIKKVLVIGSGPIIIGQAAEFDYAGTQACLALKEEGCEVVLVNNNPATIMTDEHVADVVYFEPLTVKSLQAVIEKENPDGLLATLGGQTGLNLALELHNEGILAQYELKMLGTPIESIMQAEDRQAFRALMHELDEPVPDSAIVSSLAEAYHFARRVGYPIIIRPAYTLGGSGGGIAATKNELESFVKRGLKASPIGQCLIEKSIAGLQEIEYEVIRDGNNSSVIVCDMENVDPVGIHTGDSIVVAPAQTLSTADQEMLRQAAKKIVEALGIIGGCNIQFAFDPTSKHYYIIEVNPRVSRSSALASKATGYPIAKIATKLSLGYRLHELKHPMASGTSANVEPVLDYTVVKFPRWPFDKFADADRKLGTQMKATGEVMAIEKSLASAFQKAVRSLEIDTNGLVLPELQSLPHAQLQQLVQRADDRRFFVLLELLRRGENLSVLHEETSIHYFYLEIFKHLIHLEREIEAQSLAIVTKEQLLTYKQNGFSDEWIASVWGVDEAAVRGKRKHWNITPSYERVDTCQSPYDASSAYYYSTWEADDGEERTSSSNPKVLVIGSGPIRIGQGIEFDYCSVHGVLALNEYGYDTVLINNNPETVSTDYELADRLYFEPLTVEDVVNVVDYENIDGVIVQFGGQTAISLLEGMEEAGVPVFGSSQDVIDQLEDRDRFYQLLQKINLPHIPGVIALDKQDLKEKVKEIGFPVLLRPSYVIGGKGMLIFESEKELAPYLDEMNTALHFPILIDAYYPGKEVEIDVVTDGSDVLVPGIFEHIEKAGVHSGDSLAVTPAYTLSDRMKEKIVHYARKIARNIDFKGVFNVQFVIDHDELYVLEVNPRASRTVPILSKVTGVNMIELATAVLIGKRLNDVSSVLGLLPEMPFYTIKAPVFSASKLPGVDPKLVPEMKSTGEIIAVADTTELALAETFLWSERMEKTFASGESELYIDADAAEVGKYSNLFLKLTHRGVRLVSEHADQYAACVHDVSSFDEWLKSNRAFALISLKANSDKREQAAQYGMPVLTAAETIEAFAAMAPQQKKNVRSLQQWKKIEAVVVQ